MITEPIRRYELEVLSHVRSHMPQVEIYNAAWGKIAFDTPTLEGQYPNTVIVICMTTDTLPDASFGLGDSVWDDAMTDQQAKITPGAWASTILAHLRESLEKGSPSSMIQAPHLNWIGPRRSSM